MGPYSGSGQMCASACFTKWFSQAVSWWCPLDSALYSFDRGTVVRKKNQVEHRLHGCMNFCANRGLTCKMYGRVLKIDFVPVFNTTSRARICMLCQTVFAGCQLMMSSGKCTLQFTETCSTSEEKKEWQQILLKKQQKNSLTVFFHTNPITQEMRAKKSKNVMHSYLNLI